MGIFVEHLQGKLDEKLDDSSDPPEDLTLNDLL
jgi:hypothetical protein